MLLTITLIVTFLVVTNFALLFFSCNKNTNKGKAKQPHIVRGSRVANQSLAGQLA